MSKDEVVGYQPRLHHFEDGRCTVCGVNKDLMEHSGASSDSACPYDPTLEALNRDLRAAQSTLLLTVEMRTEADEKIRNLTARVRTLKDSIKAHNIAVGRPDDPLRDP